jgi:hypothetical protein
MNKQELEILSAIRINESEVLLKAECYHGAYYLAGYALECILKACIAKLIKQFDFPDKKLANESYTHSLTKLLFTAGLKQELLLQESKDINFKLNWSLANKWSEESRYDLFIQRQDAKEPLINSVFQEKSMHKSLI